MKTQIPFPEGLGSAKIRLILTPGSFRLALSPGAEPKPPYLHLYSCRGISALTDLRNRAPRMTMAGRRSISPSWVCSRSDSGPFVAFSNLTFPVRGRFQVPAIVFAEKKGRPSLGESNQAYLLTCKARE